ncbi:MAG: spore coat associated protein CotJA [Agathobacter sp.]|nr:spore coat associated protein CotJA [Agathobacter sp.]
MWNSQNNMNMPEEDIDRMPVAMAYVPWQHFNKTYEPQKALRVGTIFPELDKPFTGRNGGMVRR